MCVYVRAFVLVFVCVRLCFLCVCMCGRVDALACVCSLARECVMLIQRTRSGLLYFEPEKYSIQSFHVRGVRCPGSGYRPVPVRYYRQVNLCTRWHSGLAESQSFWNAYPIARCLFSGLFTHGIQLGLFYRGDGGLWNEVLPKGHDRWIPSALT